MKPIPQLKNDFILNDQEYQVCKTWLNEANEADDSPSTRGRRTGNRSPTHEGDG